MRKWWRFLHLLKAVSDFCTFVTSSTIHQVFFCPSKSNQRIFFLFWNVRNTQFLWMHWIKKLQYNMFDFSINNFTVWSQGCLLCLVLFFLMCSDFSASCCRSCYGISNTAILLLTSNWQKLFSWPFLKIATSVFLFLSFPSCLDFSK